MQTTFQTTRPSVQGAFKASSLPAARRSTVVVRAQSNTDFVKELGKNMAVLAAGLALTMASPADAKVAGMPTKFEKNQAYQAELLASIKARTGKDTAVYGSLSGSPTDLTLPEYKAPAFKLEGTTKSIKADAPASTPKPLPSVSATATAPTAPKYDAPAAASSSSASFSSSSLSSYMEPVAKKGAAPAAAPTPAVEGDNKGLVAVGGIAVLGVAAAVAANSNGEGGDMQAASAGAAATVGASDVPANVASARAWIGAWKKKHGKA